LSTQQKRCGIRHLYQEMKES